MKRRTFIKGSIASAGAAMAATCAGRNASQRENLVQLTPLDETVVQEKRNWLGTAYWGNRLQDWQYKNGWIECLNGKQDFEVRTVSLLTRELLAGHKPARIQSKVRLSGQGNGFAGFLIGVGSGNLDYRASALAQRSAGAGGGFMAVVDVNGELSFRDFSASDTPLLYEKYALDESVNASSPLRIGQEIILDCHIDPTSDGKFDVRLLLLDAATNSEIGFIVRTAVDAADVTGGIMLLSSPEIGEAGARWSFTDLKTGGAKIHADDTRGLGPVMGCLHSLNRNVLKLSAQFMPIDLSQNAVARLDYKLATESEWTEGPVQPVEDGFVALYRLSDWDFTKDFDYRIVYPEQGVSLFEGQVVKDPQSSRPLKIALYSCIIPTARAIDNSRHPKRMAAERELGRYTPDNIFFPHSELVSNCDAHDPDLYVFCGDQFYETFPTRISRGAPDVKLDTLYRWYLWYWTYRESVRSRPSIILADDHDVLQGNLWGNEGVGTRESREEDGGFKEDKDLVRMVYRIEHGHNPDAYDPTPITGDIPVTYGSFVYGGTSFAVIEDRKFKTPPDYETPPLETRGELLGQRQEAFLASWKDQDKGLPKVVITASIWGSPQTGEDLAPLLDYDANGYPPDGRTRAVKLVAEAKALVLAGDQHLGMVAHQGLDSFEDGALFFAGPAAAAFWQRWFEGNGELENKYKDGKNTGNFVDTFGNKMRVMAVANPKLTHANFEAGNESWGKFLADRELKSEGYGLIRIDHQTREHTLECWPWNADPAHGNQFDGWPVVEKFEVL